MRWIGVFGFLCLAVVPALGSAVDYTFDVISSNSDIVLTSQAGGSTTMSTDGTFTVCVNQSDGHIGVSDILLLKGLDIANAEGGELGFLSSLITASIDVGSLRLTDFVEDANYTPAHIGEGGTFSTQAGVAAELSLVLSGIVTGTVTGATTGGVPVEIDGTITTSAEHSDTITMTLDFTVSSIPVSFQLLMGTTTIYMDLDVHLEGTAHQTPDPMLGGLIALGLGGAGTWLRRRRGA